MMVKNYSLIINIIIIWVAVTTTAIRAEDFSKMFPDSILTRMSNEWDDVQDCTCTMETYIRKGEQEQIRTLDYKFMKPQWIWTKIVSGKNSGSTVIYNPEKKKVIAKSGGILGVIPVSFSPQNPMVRSIRGHRLDNNHIGYILNRWFYYLKNLDISVSRSDSILTLEVDGINTSKYYGTYREKLFINVNTFFPKGFEQFDASGELIHRVKIKDVRINIGLSKSDFRF